MADKRKPLSKRTRFEVFKRDGFRCTYCGRHPPDVLLEADHIIPICEGGEDAEENLTTACCDCNRGKAGVPLTVTPQNLREKGADVAEREDQLLGYRKVMQARADRIKQDAFDVAGTLLGVPDGKPFSVDRRWLQSIKTFNERLPLHEVIDSAEKALAVKPYAESTRFKYFCGICWNKIKRANGDA